MDVKVKKVYGTINSPARVGSVGEIVYGLFYHNKIRHIGEYIPYKQSPREMLCGYYMYNPSPTREIDNICADCLKEAKTILGKIKYS